MCDNDVVNLVNGILKSAENNTGILPLSKNDIIDIKKALFTYKKDCNLCDMNAGGDSKCYNIASTKLMRSMPFMKKNIYPWRNYDWDYANYIDNNYSVNSTGASKDGSIAALFKNIKAFNKLAKGYMVEPNPSYDSKPGKLSKAGDIAYYECIGDAVDINTGKKISNPKQKLACLAKWKIKYGNNEKPPTNDKFLKKYNTSGENSSSYYVKIGSCPRPDIKNIKKCIKKGYDWIPNPLDKVMKNLPGSSRTQTKSGSCHQPRYAFLDNKPGLKIAGLKAKGLIPALANDFLSLSPDKIVAALQGKSIDDLFVIQKCPNIKESFSSIKNKNTKSLINITCCILIIIFLLFIVSKIYN